MQKINLRCQDNRNMLTGKLVSFLFFVGLWLPTTNYQWMQHELIYLVPFVFVSAIILFLSKSIDKRQALLGCLLMMGLIVFTMISNLRFSFGEAIYYLGLFFCVVLLFQMDFSKGESNDENLVSYVISMLTIATGIIIFLGIGIIVKFTPVTRAVIGSYPYFYDGLVESMVSQGKPIISFGTHSLAGFYIFVFFLLNLLVFLKKKRVTNFIFSLVMMSFLVAIKSTTSYVYLILAGIILLTVCFFWNKKIFVVGIIISVLAGIGLVMKTGILDTLKSNIVGKDSLNGIGIRYRKGGVIYNQIVNILKNPLVGTGTRSIDGTFYIDSGITHVAARTGIAGMLIFYTMFFNFIRNNLKKLSWVVIVFLIFMSFEVGFANLFYFRTLFMLPFIIYFLKVMLNEKNELFLGGISCGKNVEELE